MSLPIPEPIIPDILRATLASLGFTAVGRELSPIIFVAVTILSWPIAYVNRFFTSPSLRLLINFFVGILTLIAVYGIPTTILFAIVVVSFYYPCRYRWTRPSVITALVITALLWIHYDSMLTGTSTDRFAYTGTMMMMVAKISMFGNHMHDGHLLARGISLSPQSHIADQRKTTAITTKPYFFEYLAYQFEFMGGVIGPLFTYNEYYDFIHLKGEFKGVNSVPVLRQSILAILRAFTLLGVYMVFQTCPIFLFFKNLSILRF